MDETDGGRVLGRSSHNPAGDESTATAVVLAVSQCTDVSPTELPQLERTLDTDALDKLVASFASEETDTAGRISFQFAETAVTVSNSGEIVVESVELE